MKRKKRLIFGCIITILACSLPGQTISASRYQSEVYGSIIASVQPQEPSPPAKPAVPEQPKNPSWQPTNQGAVKKAEKKDSSQKSDKEEQETKENSDTESNILYRLWENQKSSIPASLFTKALSEKKDIEIHILSKDGATEYIIRMKYEDISETEVRELEEIIFDLEIQCKNYEEVESHYELEDARYICMCNWPKLPGKASVEVVVSWPEETGVKEYRYKKDTKKLELMGNEHLVKDGMTGISYDSGNDAVLSKKPIEEKKSISNWIDAVKEERIDKTYSNMVIFFAIVSLLALAGGGVLFFLLYKKKKNQEKGEQKDHE